MDINIAQKLIYHRFWFQFVSSCCNKFVLCFARTMPFWAALQTISNT